MASPAAQRAALPEGAQASGGGFGRKPGRGVSGKRGDGDGDDGDDGDVGDVGGVKEKIMR